MIVEGKNEKLGRYVYIEVNSVEFDDNWNIINFNSIANLDLIQDFDNYKDWKFKVFGG